MTSKNIIGIENDSGINSWTYNPTGLDDVVKATESYVKPAVNSSSPVSSRRIGPNRFNPSNVVVPLGKLIYVNGMPRISLNRIDTVVVNVSSEKNYLQLKRFYDCAGWKYIDDLDPTLAWHILNAREKGAYCTIEKSFTLHDKEFFINSGFKLMSLEKFCEKQSITPDTTKLINDYYDNKK